MNYIKINVFKYDELSSKAKERVLSDVRERNWDPEVHTEWLRDRLKDAGFVFGLDNKTDIEWSTFQQGAGVAWYIKYTSGFDLPVLFKALIKEGYVTRSDVQYVKRLLDEGATLSINPVGAHNHYAHYNTMGVNLTLTGLGWLLDERDASYYGKGGKPLTKREAERVRARAKAAEDFEEGLGQYVRDLSRKLHAELERTILDEDREESLRGSNALDGWYFADGRWADDGERVVQELEAATMVEVTQ